MPILPTDLALRGTSTGTGESSQAGLQTTISDEQADRLCRLRPRT